MIHKSDWVRLGPRTILERGDTCRINGQSGLHRFLAHARTDSGDEWVDVIHHSRKGGIRSYHLDRIRRASR